MVLSRPLAHTNSFLYSNFISLWSSLSAEQVSAPSLHAFKRLVCLLLEKKKLPGKLRASADLRGAIQFLSGSKLPSKNCKTCIKNSVADDEPILVTSCVQFSRSAFHAEGFLRKLGSFWKNLEWPS